jgi:hypothetical protein
MLQEPLPIPLTDLRRRVNVARNLIRTVLTELVGPVELAFDFYREWNGCWRVRVEIKDPINGRLEFTLMDTPGGGMLALPRPLPERWRSGDRGSLRPTAHVGPWIRKGHLMLPSCPLCRRTRNRYSP